MSADPAVLQALQAAHNLEATASEKWHKQEHCFKVTLKHYPGLGCFFDRRHKEAYCRQHDLRKHMMNLKATVETELGDTSYTEDVEQAFTDACDLLDKLMDAYRDIRKAAKEWDTPKGDWTREKFHGYVKDLEDIYQKGERRLQQIKDLGLPGFLALMT